MPAPIQFTTAQDGNTAEAAGLGSPRRRRLRRGALAAVAGLLRLPDGGALP